MFVFIVGNFLVIPLAVLSHPSAGAFFHGLVVPGVQGGFTSTSVLLIIAIVGTTVAPWQLFFQQSNIVDKRITPRWINYERADTVLGSIVTVFAASLLMAITGVGLRRHATRTATSPTPEGSPTVSALRGARRRRHLRDHPAQRLDHRRRGGHPRHVVRVR